MMHRKLFIATLVAASVVTAACSDTTAPKDVVRGRVAAATPAPSFSASFPRSGALHVTKECSQYTRLAGGFCTITSSNIDAIEVGSRVIYASDAVPPVLDTDIRLDPPGPGNNAAFGHVVLSFVTLRGQVTISGGTGKFTWLEASAVVSHLGGPNWAWDGTYSFSPRD